MKVDQQIGEDLARPVLSKVWMGRVLIAECNDAMRGLLLMSFRAAGIEAEGVSDGHELRRVVQGEGSDAAVVVSAVRMPGWSGLAALQWLVSHRPSTRVIMLTALGDTRARQRAEELGAFEIYEKPFDISALSRLVSRLLSSCDDTDDS